MISRPAASTTPNTSLPSSRSDGPSDGSHFGDQAVASGRPSSRSHGRQTVTECDRYGCRAVNALCPNCGEADGEVTERTGNTESGVRMDFSCPECDHDWSVTL